MKKIYYGLGALGATAIPLAVVSCACSSKSETKTFDTKYFKTKDNTAVLDFTKGEEGDKFMLNSSKEFFSGEGAFDYINLNFQEHLDAHLKWLEDAKSKWEKVKVAIKYYRNAVSVAIVYYIDPKLIETRHSRLFNFLHDLKRLSDEDRSSVDWSNQFVDFENPNWPE